MDEYVQMYNPSVRSALCPPWPSHMGIFDGHAVACPILPYKALCCTLLVPSWRWRIVASGRKCIGLQVLLRMLAVLPVLATPSSCLALVRCPTEGIALLTGAIANVSHPPRERAHLQSPSFATVCACEAVVGLGPVAAKP